MEQTHSSEEIITGNSQQQNTMDGAFVYRGEVVYEVLLIFCLHIHSLHPPHPRNGILDSHILFNVRDEQRVAIADTHQQYVSTMRGFWCIIYAYTG